MKIDPKAPAYPNPREYFSKGITIRAEIASRVLTGIYSDPSFAGSHEGAAACAVCAADALIAELNK